MVKAYKDFWTRYFDFKGKTSVPGYWWVVLINIIISAVLGILGSVGATVAGIYSLLTLIPGFAIVFRRLHDGRRSGWNLLWLLLPVVGWIILIVLLATKGK